MLETCPLCGTQAYAPYPPALQRIEDDDGVVHEMCFSCWRQWERSTGSVKTALRRSAAKGGVQGGN